MNNKPRWVNVLVIYVAMLIPVMITLYALNSFLQFSGGILWMVGLLGTGLIVNLFAQRIF